jgi:hypothetical protein
MSKPSRKATTTVTTADSKRLRKLTNSPSLTSKKFKRHEQEEEEEEDEQESQKAIEREMVLLEQTLVVASQMVDEAEAEAVTEETAVETEEEVAEEPVVEMEEKKEEEPKQEEEAEMKEEEIVAPPKQKVVAKSEPVLDESLFPLVRPNGQRDDKALLLVQQTISQIATRYGLWFPPLKTEAGDPLTSVKLNKGYVNMGYKRTQNFPGCEFYEVAFMSPLARLSMEKYAMQFYPCGTNSSTLCKWPPGPKVTFVLTNEPLLQGSKKTNTIFDQFHDMLYKEYVPEVMEMMKRREIASEGFKKDWDGLKEICDKGLKVVEEKVKKGWASLAAERKEPEFKKEWKELNDGEVMEEKKKQWKAELQAYQDTEPEFAEMFATVHTLNTSEHGDGDQKKICFKHNMLRQLKDTESDEMARVLDNEWISSCGDESLTEKIKIANRTIREMMNNPKLSVEEKKKLRYYTDNELAVYRCLSDAEAKKNPKQDTLIRMTQQQVLKTVRPGDWVSVVFSYKRLVSGNATWINPQPCAMIWFAHHDAFAAAATGLDPEAAAISKPTFSLAQLPDEE